MHFLQDGIRNKRCNGEVIKDVKYKFYDELPLMRSMTEVAAVLSIGSRIVVPKDKFIAWVEAKVSEKSADIR